MTSSDELSAERPAAVVQAARAMTLRTKYFAPQICLNLEPEAATYIPEAVINLQEAPVTHWHCATEYHPLLQDLPIRFKASLFTYEKNKRGEFVLFVFFFYYYYRRPFPSTLFLERNFLLIMQAA